MTQITLTPDQFASLSQASGRVLFSDPQGRIFVEVERIVEDPHRLRATSIRELIDELKEDELDEEGLQEILENYKPVATLSQFLQRVTGKVDAVQE